MILNFKINNSTNLLLKQLINIFLLKQREPLYTMQPLIAIHTKRKSLNQQCSWIILKRLLMVVIMIYPIFKYGAWHVTETKQNKKKQTAYVNIVPTESSFNSVVKKIFNSQLCSDYAFIERLNEEIPKKTSK